MTTQGTWPPAGASLSWDGDAPAGGSREYTGLAGHSRRRARRWLRLARLSVLAWFLVVVAVAVWAPHGWLIAAILALAGLPALMAVTVTAVLALVVRWAWRSTAWLEVVPLAAGAPWLSRLLWAARALLAGRAAWRAGRRLHRRVSRAPAA